jgi:quercetin dioxygenase-like cupin family protein
MTNQRSKFRNYFLFGAVSFLVAFFIGTDELSAQTEDVYKVLKINTELNEGKSKEVKPLFEGERRKIVQLTLRNEMRSDFHSVAEPITIECIAGEGELIIEAGDKTDKIELNPGTYITLESNVMHDVVGKPSVSIILTRFLSVKE